MRWKSPPPPVAYVKLQEMLIYLGIAYTEIVGRMSQINDKTDKQRMWNWTVVRGIHWR
jgi:hypothetical protein